MEHPDPADDGQRNCPKHVEFHSKNKFEKLMHQVGFIIQIYHDARSYESQISWLCSQSLLVCPTLRKENHIFSLSLSLSRRNTLLLSNPQLRPDIPNCFLKQ
jgi:hypothetical protein